MMIVLTLSHKQGMKTVDGLQLEMKVLVLRNGRFKINIDKSVQISKFSQEFKYTLVADFSDGNLDTSQVEDHLTEQSFFDDADYFRFTGGIYDYLFEQRQGIKTYVFLTQCICTYSMSRDS